MLYYMPIILAALSNVGYHILQKALPASVNPLAALAITYATAMLFSLLLLPFHPAGASFSQLKLPALWPSVALGLIIVGLEMGFLLAYRAGWNISLASLVANAAVALTLIPIGIWMYKEHFSGINLLGVILCLLGLVLIKK